MSDKRGVRAEEELERFAKSTGGRFPLPQVHSLVVNMSHVSFKNEIRHVMSCYTPE